MLSGWVEGLELRDCGRVGLKGWDWGAVSGAWIGVVVEGLGLRLRS